MLLDEPNTNLIEEPETTMESVHSLWCAVIEEQFELATAPIKKDRPYEVLSARMWFGSREYYTVCALAGFDPEWLLAGVMCVFDELGIR